MTNSPGIHPHTRLGHLEALEGARILERRLELAANNMANAATPGFKAQRMGFEEYLLARTAEARRTAKGETPRTCFGQGTLEETQNPLDFAIEGEGFFVVDTPAGRRYTRAGNFTLDAENQLVTREGYTVLGDGAPVVLDDTTGVGVWLSDDGRFFVDETESGRLDVVRFANPQLLERSGMNLFSASDETGPEIPSDSRVRQGFLETSNVNPVETMMHLIDLYRAYEAQQKALQAGDQMDNRAANDLGKLA